MTRDDEIFADALELPAAERAAFLTRACAGDPEGQARIAALLAGHEAAGAFLQKNPHVPAAAPVPAGDQPGDRIGRYTVLRTIGEGGCGVVYLVEQAEPVRRRAALKVIKPGMDSREVIARFEAERQALALMDHPGIARVFDAGTTGAGRPYFVMEFVDGQPITNFCDTQRLPMAARLELFTQVCHAVQHAHQKGVIHRDLKPSNILVALHDGVPVPKVIDFGIAKATQGRLTDATIATALAQFIGTPAYMSPEQAELSSADVDTRTDIYSLGVLLYELLTGRTPFEIAQLLQAGFDEMRRHIREVEPPRPSTRLHTLGAEKLATTAGQRHVPPPKLLSLVAGDLDWIVMRCLEKDRARRYESASDLAQDLRRHLDHEPVEARPASTAYRLKKLIRRHRLAFAAAAAVLLALCTGLTASVWQAIRAQRAELSAQREAAIARAVNDFLLSDLLRQADSRAQAEARLKPNPDLKVREALDRAAERVGTRFKDQPLTEAAVRLAIGESYLGLGLAAAAEPHLRRAHDLRRAALATPRADRWAAQLALARALVEQSKFADALALQSAVLAEQTGALGATHPATDVTRNDLADNYDVQGQHAEAARLQTLTLANRERQLGPEHPDTLWSMGNLGNTYYQLGKYAEAADFQRRALAGRRRALGAEHPATLNAASNYATTLKARGRIAEAITLQTETLAGAERGLGPDHFQTIACGVNLASAYTAAGRRAEAIPLLQRAIASADRTLGPDHQYTLTARNNLASALIDLNRLDESRALFERNHAAQLRVFGAKHPHTLGTMINLANVYRRLNRIDPAMALVVQARTTATAELGPEHPITLAAMHLLGLLHEVTGRHAEALQVRQAVLEIRTRTLGADHATTIASMSNLAATCELLGRTDEHVALRTRIRDAQQRILGPAHPQVVIALANLGTALLAAQRFAEAEPLLRAVLAHREKTSADEWTTFNTRTALGGSLLGQRKLAEAEPLLLSGGEGLLQREANIPAVSRVRVSEALERLVQLYTDLGQTETAAGWRQKLEARRPAAAPKP